MSRPKSVLFVHKNVPNYQGRNMQYCIESICVNLHAPKITAKIKLYSSFHIASNNNRIVIIFNVTTSITIITTTIGSVPTVWSQVRLYRFINKEFC